MVLLNPAERQPLRPLAWVIAAFVGGLLLHIDRVPLWVSAVGLVCAAWQIGGARGRLRTPARPVRAVLTVALVGAVLATFHTLNGLQAGTVLLIVMGSVKLLETQARRDRYIVCGAAIFLLLAACLDRQDLLRAPLYLLQAWVCCAALAVAANGTDALSDAEASKLAARNLALAVPLAIVLFLFFPRLAGSFWALPRMGGAESGLSDSMSPGSISQLILSYDPAFRARFDGPPPPRQELYWRGPVLHDFDGYTWSRVPGRFYAAPKLEPEGPAYRYHVSLEPSTSRWWFALDVVAGSPSARVFLTPDHELIAQQPVAEVTSYDAVSHTHTRNDGTLSRLAARYDTELPANRNPRTRSLGLQLRARAQSDVEFARAALEVFRTGGFEYTLIPPALDLDSVDDLLFHTRRGFCGHFASAYVALMRAGGVPAHVVTGYLGGEWNPIGGYFIVRQSDAHAWAEIWLAGRGWTRVDPTAVVAPERLRRGLLDLLPNSVWTPTRLMHTTPWLASLLHRWDALNNWWNERVVKFDFRTQLDVLSWLGFASPDWRELGWALSTGLIAWLAWVAWQAGRVRPASVPDRLGRAYKTLCVKLARAGMAREAHQGPLAYADALGVLLPELAATSRPLLERYAELRYGASGDGSRPQSIAAFEKAVARLRVSRVR